MQHLEGLVQWVRQDLVVASAVLFGGSVTALLIYTYLCDYAAAMKRN